MKVSVLDAMALEDTHAEAHELSATSPDNTLLGVDRPRARFLTSKGSVRTNNIAEMAKRGTTSSVPNPRTSPQKPIGASRHHGVTSEAFVA